MWMLPLYLHINQKSDYDYDDDESLLCSDASHQVSAQSDLWFGRRCRMKNFKMAAVLDIGTEQF